MQTWLVPCPSTPKFICELCPSPNAECGAFDMFTGDTCSRKLLVIIFSTTCPRNAIGKAFWVIFSLLRIQWTTAIFKVLNLFLEKHFTLNVHEFVAK